MAPRPNWKGYLKLSLVSCPIALYPASSSTERVSFRQINRQTGHRLKQQLVDSVTGEVVESKDKGRGYEVGRDQFIPIEDEEIEAIQVESTRTIDIGSFVPREEIDIRFIDSPYYIVPTDQVGQEAFAVIREAMRQKNLVGIATVVMAKRERPIMIEAFGKGLRAVTLRYPYEVRPESSYFEEIPDIAISGEMLKLAEHILDSKAGAFDPAAFVDEYETALVDLLQRKQAGQPAKPVQENKAPARVINLMDALRRSVAADRTAPRRAAPPAKARRATSERRRKAG